MLWQTSGAAKRVVKVVRMPLLEPLLMRYLVVKKRSSVQWKDIG